MSKCRQAEVFRPPVSAIPKAMLRDIEAEHADDRTFTVNTGLRGA